MERLVRLEKKDGWAVMVLERNVKVNAMSVPFLKEIGQTIDELNRDSAIRAVVVTGSEGTFISGGDLERMRVQDVPQSMEYVKIITDMMDKMTASPKIFIAAINGHALGGGCEFALACDIRIAAETARIGLPEVTLGIIPGAGGTQRLHRVIGMGRAAEMILTGGVVTARRALEIGLVTDVVPPEALMDKAEELAEKIKKTSPVAVAAAKECLYQASNLGLDAGIVYERRMTGLCFAAPDREEGITAFFEKRPANFPGQ